MPDPIKIEIQVNDDGSLAVLDQAGNKLQELQSVTDKSQDSTKAFGLSLTDLKSGFDMISSGVSKAYQLFEQLNQVGTASLRAKSGFEALGGSTSIIDQMRSSTKGLVDDTELYRTASFAISSGAIKNQADLAELARIGATLGTTFQGSATAGIDSFTRALGMVGNTRGLRQLGIDAEAVKSRFDDLKKTMSDQDAWKMAVFEVASQNADKLKSSLTGVGTPLERLKVLASNTMTSVAEDFTKATNAVLNFMNAIDIAKGQKVAAGLSTFNPSDMNMATFIPQYQSLQGPQQMQALQSLLAQGKIGNQGFLYDQAIQYGLMQNTGPWTQSNGNPTLFGSTLSPDVANRALAASQTATNLRFSQTPDYASTGYESGGNTDYRKMRSDLDDLAETWPKVNLAAGTHFKILAQEDAYKRLRSDLDDMNEKWPEVNHSVSVHKDLVAQANQELEHQKQLQNGLGSVFGFHQNQTQGDLGGMMQQGFGDATQSYQDMLKKRLGQRDGSGVYTKKEMDADMAAFTKQAQDAQDQYALATGAATKESLKLRDVQADLTAGLGNGTIKATEASKAYLALAKAAQDGTLNLSKLSEIERDARYASAPQGSRNSRHIVTDGNEEGPDVTGRGGRVLNAQNGVSQGDSDPFAGATTSLAKFKDQAAEANNKMDALKIVGASVGGILAGAGLEAGAGWLPAAGIISKVKSDVQWLQANGHVSVTIGVKTTGGIIP